MQNRNSFPTLLLIGLLAAFALAIVAAFVIKSAKSSRADLPVITSVPEFTLTERSGQEITRSDMLGTLWVVDFIFTNCPSACPIMSREMAELYEVYSHSSNIRFLSISVDPERDTLETLRDYAKSLGVTDNRWLFARGPIEKVIQISEKGFLLPAENLPMGHSTKFVLVDEQANIRGYYDALNKAEIELMKTHIRELARKMR